MPQRPRLTVPSRNSEPAANLKKVEPAKNTRRRHRPHELREQGMGR
jgi:hypothetical protein